MRRLRRQTRKTALTQHGIVTPKYIKYNRRDVLATSELTVKLLEEYDKHDIKLQETKAYSPASIGKAYLRRMGIKPILQRQRNFPKAFLGHAQSAFSGGRTSATHSQIAGSHRLYRFSFDVHDGQQPHGLVALRHCSHRSRSSNTANMK